MTTDDRFRSMLTDWLEEQPARAPDQLLDSVISDLRRTPQRARWRVAIRRSTMLGSNPVRYGAVAVVGLLAVAVVLGVWAEGGGGVGAPSPALTPTPSASPTPTATTAVSPSPTARRLGGQSWEAGAWFVEVQDVRVTFDLPAGWGHGSDGQLKWLLPPAGPPAPLLVTTVDNVHDRPCGEPHSPAVGPSVDDLANALAELQGLEGSTPTDTTVDGYRGKQFTLKAPEALEGCGEEIAIWYNSGTDLESYVDFGEETSIWIVDVDGTRLLIRTMAKPGTSAGEQAAVQQIFNSIRLEPVGR